MKRQHIAILSVLLISTCLVAQEYWEDSDYDQHMLKEEQTISISTTTPDEQPKTTSEPKTQIREQPHYWDDRDYEKHMLKPGEDVDPSVIPPDPKSYRYSIFKFAWEMPNYADRYEHLEKAPWLEPSNLAEIFGEYTKRRSVEHSDTHAGTWYASIRPFVFDFKSFSVSTGVSYIGTYSYIQESDILGPLTLFGETFVGYADGQDLEVWQHMVNVSNLISVPEWSLQFILSGGYGWWSLKDEIRDVYFDGVTLPFLLHYYHYRYEQHSEGVTGSLSILKSFNRNWLNFFSLTVRGFTTTKTTVRESEAYLSFTNKPLRGSRYPATVRFGKQTVPYSNGPAEFGDLQEAEKLDLHIISGTLSTRLITFYTPFSESRGISIGGFGTIGHLMGELLGDDFYGVSMKAGGTLALFEGLSLTGAYIWERNNDLGDGWEFSVSIVLLGIVREALDAF